MIKFRGVKILLINFCLMVLFLFCINLTTGCIEKKYFSQINSQKKIEPKKLSKKNLPTIKKITIGSGGKTGVYYPFAVSIGELLTAKLKIPAKGISTRGSAWNTEQLEKKQYELAMIQNDLAFYSLGGYDKTYKNENLRAIGSLYSEDVHIVVREDSNIKTLRDLRGKIVSTGNPDSGQYKNAKQILTMAGLFNEVKHDSSKIDNAIKKFINKEIDGIFFTAGWPNIAIKDITKTINCRFISLDKPLVKKLISNYPFYVKSFIPCDVYKNLKKNVQTVAVRATLCTRSDLPESLIYMISKLIFENIDELKKNHSKWDSVNLIDSKLGIGIPFHSGAERFFNENVVSVRLKPYPSALTVGYVKRGDHLKIFDRRWDMYQIIMKNGEKGWIEENEVINYKQSPVKGYVSTGSLNFRKFPSLKNIPIGVVFKNEPVQKIGEYYNIKEGIKWINVIRNNGEKGWVSSNYLRPYDISGYSGTVKMPKKQL